jgi:uroporphyrinogen-III synthase
MTAGPLAGRRIVVTRPLDQAEPLVRRLRAVGAEPIVVPLIEVVDAADGGAALAGALGRLDDFEWVVVTSPNGARRVAAALAGTQSASPQVAAVGTATAAALGRAADLVPDEQIAAALVAVFPAGVGRVLVAQAEIAGREVADGLAAKGWTVEVVAAYGTRPVRPTSAHLLAALSAQAVLFASGSAVRSWTAVFGRETPPLVIAIGPATAAVAEDLGLKVDAVAADHSLDGLVSCLLTSLVRS